MADVVIAVSAVLAVIVFMEVLCILPRLRRYNDEQEQLFKQRERDEESGMYDE